MVAGAGKRQRVAAARVVVLVAPLGINMRRMLQKCRAGRAWKPHDVWGEGHGVCQAAVVVKFKIFCQIRIIHEKRVLVRRETAEDKR